MHCCICLRSNANVVSVRVALVRNALMFVVVVVVVLYTRSCR